MSPTISPTIAPTTIHASAVLVGPWAVLIRGPSGAGKSQLAFALIDAARNGRLRFARLIADDRVVIETHHGRLLVRPAPALAGLIELHGIGIRRLPFEAMGVVSLVVDLAASDAARMPEPVAAATEINGIVLPRLGVAPEHEALTAVIACLATGARLPAKAPVVAMHHPS
jgi:HPr kinase/phosphorylase